MIAGPLRGLITLTALGDQAFAFPPLLLSVGIFLFDFTRHEEDALIRDLKDHCGTLFKFKMPRMGAGTVTCPSEQ